MYIISHICVYKHMTCRKLWPAAHEETFWEIPRYSSSLVHIINHLHSTATNSNTRCGLHFNSPQTKHTLALRMQTSWFPLFCPFIPALSLSLSVSWHSRAVSKMTPHALNESRLLKPEISYRLRKKYFEEKENSSHGQGVFSLLGLDQRQNIHNVQIVP